MDIFADSEQNQKLDHLSVGHSHDSLIWYHIDEIEKEKLANDTLSEPTSDFTEPAPPYEFKLFVSKRLRDWAFSQESGLTPFVDTVMFLFDLIPTVFLCNILSQTTYKQYDEVTMELICINKAF